MPYEIRSEEDLVELETESASVKPSAPIVLSVADLLALDVPEPEMLVESLLPKRGACLLFGAPKSNKTLLSVQVGIAVASGNPLFDYYRILESGPVLMVEQDDPAGAASVKTILLRSPIKVLDIPFHLAPRVPFSFGPELIEWLEQQIVSRKLRLVILDSYTALRSSRKSGIDIVKAEQLDLTLLDELAKRTGCTIIVVHHDSKGSAAMDWSQKAAGTFAMSAATGVQIHISRFADLDSFAPERLVRVRGRHLEGTEMVLRFRKETLDHEHVLEGGAATMYPLVLQLHSAFGIQSFTPKDCVQATGDSRATVHRQIDRLCRAGAVNKTGFGQYVLAAMKQRDT